MATRSLISIGAILSATLCRSRAFASAFSFRSLSHVTSRSRSSSSNRIGSRWAQQTALVSAARPLNLFQPRNDSIDDDDATERGSLLDVVPRNTKARAPSPSTATLVAVLVALSTTAAAATLGPAPARAGVGDVLNAAVKNSEISYSSNAKNLNRLSTGDSSGGSRYDNDVVGPAARRRAMLGCKIEASRRLAGMGGDEKACNLRVMGGDTTFMLDALKKLDCPTCPYGVADKIVN